MLKKHDPELKVRFLGCSTDPVEILYSILQVRLNHLNPVEVWHITRQGTTSRSSMLDFIATSTTPLQRKSALPHAQFIFAVEDISHDCLKRFHDDSVNQNSIGNQLDLQSIEHPGGFQTPQTFQENPLVFYRWKHLQKELADFIEFCALQGIPERDRQLLQFKGTHTRDLFSMEFKSIQQFLEQGMCEVSTRETRELAWQIYSLMKTEFPRLAGRLGIKCWENRQLFCDESYRDFCDCKFGSGHRPHKQDLRNLWQMSNSRHKNRSALSI